MYPLKFKNIYYEKVWGGRDLARFRDNLPDGNIGESWDVACHPHGMSIISNGEFKDTRLDDLIKQKGEGLIGKKISKNRFQILIKILNTRGKLSVQVHPNDEYAKRVENEMGKNEVWYVMDAFEDANLIVGLKKKCTQEKLRKAIEDGNLEDCMNKVPIKKGETYFIKSGLIHTICEGAIIVEIQQNSDTTYRVYDYNRGRELHIEKALEAIDFNLKGEKSTGLKVEKDDFSKTYLCLGKDFSLELYEVNSNFFEKSDAERFYIFTCVEGRGKIAYESGVEHIKKGDSIFIPASLGAYRIEGKMKLLKSYIPDIEKVEQEILREVRK
ncbi:MAG: class I mannose-6-phosphate isomerase [Marinisporobacter sp.]|jgi:mannose-6-phosphate isomerase|nr:class I mannose-6-phosphate isomerase [Marinisporobacter sp.]